MPPSDIHNSPHRPVPALTQPRFESVARCYLLRKSFLVQLYGRFSFLALMRHVPFQTEADKAVKELQRREIDTLTLSMVVEVP